MKVPSWAALMKPTPSPFANGMRVSRGNAGSNRSASIHMLTAVRCAGRMRWRVGVSFCLIKGSSDTTMGSRRALLTPTATAVSTALAPPPSAEIRITCPGATHSSRVEAATHHRLKPKSCASAAMPT